MSDYDPAENSRRCYELGLRCGREKAVREHVFLPRPDDATEIRWAAEGPVPNNELETVRHG